DLALVEMHAWRQNADGKQLGVPPTRWDGRDRDESRRRRIRSQIEVAIERENGRQVCPRHSEGVDGGFVVVRRASDLVIDCGFLARQRPCSPTSHCGPP